MTVGTSTVGSATLFSMKAAANVQEKITLYCQKRLQTELAAHGSRDALARAAKVAGATLSNIKNWAEPVGMDVALALAAHWGMSLGELEEEAIGVPRSESSDAIVNRAKAEVIRELHGKYDPEFLAQFTPQAFHGLDSVLLAMAKNNIRSIIEQSYSAAGSKPASSRGTNELDAEADEASKVTPITKPKPKPEPRKDLKPGPRRR